MENEPVPEPVLLARQSGVTHINQVGLVTEAGERLCQPSDADRQAVGLGIPIWPLEGHQDEEAVLRCQRWHTIVHHQASSLSAPGTAWSLGRGCSGRRSS